MDIFDLDSNFTLKTYVLACIVLLFTCKRNTGHKLSETKFHCNCYISSAFCTYQLLWHKETLRVASMRINVFHMKLTRDTHLMQQFIYYYKQIYMFRASICPSSGVLGCILITLLLMVSSTRCCGWGSEEPVCSLVHWCKFCIRLGI